LTYPQHAWLAIGPRRVALVLVVSAVLAAASSAAPAHPKSAPPFVLPGRAGTVALDSLRGRVVLVDFWASWCTPCRSSFPWMQALHEKYSRRGLTIVAINLDKDRAAADAFLEENPATFTVAFDPKGKTAEAYRVEAMPSSYLIGPTGTVLHAHAGFDPKQTGTFETLIQEACKP